MMSNRMLNKLKSIEILEKKVIDVYSRKGIIKHLSKYKNKLDFFGIYILLNTYLEINYENDMGIWESFYDVIKEKYFKTKGEDNVR